MRKSLILLVTMLFLAAPAFVSAAVDQKAVSENRSAQVVPVARTYNGNLPMGTAAEKMAMNNPGQTDEILLAKRDGRKGHRGGRGHHRFRGHHGFKKHHFGNRHHFKGHHFKSHKFKRHHHRGFSLFRPFYNYRYCERYSPFYGYYRLPYRYCRY